MVLINPEISIKKTRQLLAREGESVLPRAAYERYLKNGILDAPVRRAAGERAYHTLEQVAVAITRLSEGKKRASTPVANRTGGNLSKAHRYFGL